MPCLAMTKSATAKSDRQVFCLDIEASSLGSRSFPIEVAVTDIVTAETQSWLIRPTIEWLKSGDWSDGAQAVHGITKSELIKNGLPVRQVVRELTARVNAAVVLSDEQKYDQDWLDKLFLAANKIKITPTLANFREYAQELAHRRQQGEEAGQAIWVATIAAKEIFPQRHRAGPDASRNAEILRQLAGAP